MSATKKNRAEAVDPAVMETLVQRMRRAWPTVKNTDGPEALKQMACEHRGVHDDAGVEWWYINSHIPEKNMSLFASFFRLVENPLELLKGKTRDSAAAGRWYVMLAALSDLETDEYLSIGRVDKDIAPMLRNALDTGLFPLPDQYIRKALVELLDENKVPEPDFPMKRHAAFFEDMDGDIKMDFDGHTFEMRKDGTMHLVCDGEAIVTKKTGVVKGQTRHVHIDLELKPTKAPILHGVEGVVNVAPDDRHNDMFYYIVPRCTAEGTIRSGEKVVTFGPDQGRGWVDHEFGACVPENAAELKTLIAAAAEKAAGGLAAVNWEWTSIQLDNDVEISLTRLKPAGDSPLPEQVFAVVREGTNPAYRVDNPNFVPDESCVWVSPDTSQKFTTKYYCDFKLQDGTPVKITLAVKLVHQEFITLSAHPSFLEGHTGVSAEWRGETVTGQGFTEICARTSAGAAEAVFAGIQAILVEPAVAAVALAKPKTLEEAIPHAKPSMMTFIAVAAMQPGPKISPEAQNLMLHTIAAVHFIRSAKGDAAEADRAAEWLEGKWATDLRPSMPNDGGRLMMRAWMIRCVAEAREFALGPEEPTTDPTAPRELADFVIPPEAALTTPVTDAVVAAARKLFGDGKFKMNRQMSDALMPLMSAQGMGFVIRQIADRVTPTLDITVTKEDCLTHITTAVSDETRSAKLQGKPTDWFSAGRGDLVTYNTFMDGGRTLYQRTVVPVNTAGVEHKWFRAEEIDSNGVAHLCVERHVYHPDGVENDKTIVTTRYFKRQ